MLSIKIRLSFARYYSLSYGVNILRMFSLEGPATFYNGNYFGGGDKEILTAYDRSYP